MNSTGALEEMLCTMEHSGFSYRRAARCFIVGVVDHLSITKKWKNLQRIKPDIALQHLLVEVI